MVVAEPNEGRAAPTLSDAYIRRKLCSARVRVVCRVRLDMIVGSIFD